MDKFAVVQNEDCWICFSNENIITLTIVDSEKVLKNCETYLDTSIIIKSFENDSAVFCCRYCCESAHQLTLLEEQAEKIQKEIADLSSIFSEKVLERRNLIKIEKSKIDHEIIPSRAKCFTIQKNHFIEMKKNGGVKDEVIETVSKELATDSDGNTKRGTNIFYEHNTFNKDVISQSEDAIKVKYSYDETVSQVIDIVNEEHATNRRTSIINAQGDQKLKTTSMADLLISVKMPVIQLERLQPGRIKGSQKIAAAAVERTTVKCEIDLDEIKPYKCSICGQGFVEMCDLEDHDKLHNKERSYHCSVCDKSFLKHRFLKVHEISHTEGYIEKRSFTCSVCSKSFTRIGHLKSHKYVHTAKKRYNCSCCEKSFVTDCDLKTHERVHTGERPFDCSICSKSFKTARDVRRHKRIHSAKRPFNCSSCSKSYTCSSNLRTHERVHTGERPFNCSACSKSYSILGSLRTHERVHTGERPFNCSVCSKSFQSSSLLRRHEDIHSGKKPHRCSFCVKSFFTNWKLKIHERLHKGERPFTCSFCSKSFTSAYHLQRHEIIHTGEKQYSCPNCEKSFHRKDALTLHLQRKHGEQNQEFILPS